jgi:hypothetical protein
MSEINKALANLGLDPFQGTGPAGEELIRPEERALMIENARADFESVRSTVEEVVNGGRAPVSKAFQGAMRFVRDVREMTAQVLNDQSSEELRRNAFEGLGSDTGAVSKK